jgi:hypothetical protein
MDEAPIQAGMTDAERQRAIDAALFFYRANTR